MAAASFVSKGMTVTSRVVLDNVEHHALRVILRGSPDLDRVNQTLIVPTEFEEAQREYPILFRKDSDGKFVAVALLGFDKGENLFLEGEQWNARYIPAAHRRGPFFLGVRETEELGETKRELALHIDLDDPRVSESDGEPVFKPHGGNSAYLEYVMDALNTVHDGLRAAPAMFAAFEQLRLIQPVELNVEIGDGLTYSIPNFFTIGAEQFAALGGDALEQLHRSGFLAAAIHVRSSLGNVERLIERKSRGAGRG